MHRDGRTMQSKVDESSDEAALKGEYREEGEKDRVGEGKGRKEQRGELEEEEETED